MRFGKSSIYWCNQCNIPLISENCGLCGSKGKKLELTPPGDLAPPFNKKELIQEIIENEFNIPGNKFLPDNNIVLINPMTALDDAYQIITDGMILGQLRFEPDKKDWRIILQEEGAARAYLLGCESNIVKVDEGAVPYIKEGANALAPGIVESDRDIEYGDECIIIRDSMGNRKPNDVLGTGLAKMDGQEMIESSHGVGVKSRGSRDLDYKDLSMSRDWDDVLRANRKHLEDKVEEAIGFMENLSEDKDLPIGVMFSGGKDSLAVLLLSLNLFNKDDFDIIFNDTGIEFPETFEYIEEIEQEIDKEIERAEAGNIFWDAIEDFGPPGKDYRWCCKTSKLGPISNFIEEEYEGEGEKLLVFSGERKYESQSRHDRGRTWRNPWIPGEVGSSPIKHWRALEVWLYIFDNDLPYNELYEDFDRIGCWLCPSSSLAELTYVQRTHPELWDKFRTELENFADQKDLPEEWIENGFWRWKELTSGEENLAEDLDLDPAELSKERGRKEIEILKTLESEKKDLINRKLDLDRLNRTLNILGEYRIEGCGEDFRIVFEDKDLEIGSDYIKGKKSNREKALNVVKKAFECVECKVCGSVCPIGAIYFDESGVRVGEDCVGCEHCLEPCPLSFK